MIPKILEREERPELYSKLKQVLHSILHLKYWLETTMKNAMFGQQVLFFTFCFVVTLHFTERVTDKFWNLLKKVNWIFHLLSGKINPKTPSKLSKRWFHTTRRDLLPMKSWKMIGCLWAKSSRHIKRKSKYFITTRRSMPNWIRWDSWFCIIWSEIYLKKTLLIITIISICSISRIKELLPKRTSFKF